MSNSCQFLAEDPPEHQLVRDVVYSAVIPVIASIGFVLNGFCTFAAIRSTLNSVTLSYLLSLTISNTGLMIVAVPWLLYKSADPLKCMTFSAAFYHAHLELPFMNTLATFSLYVLVCTSVERYFSVCHPAIFRRIHKRSVAQTSLLVSLLMALAVNAVLFLNRQQVVCDDCWTTQVAEEITKSQGWIAYICCLQVFTRFLPCLLLIVLNVRMIIKLRRIIRKRGDMTTNAVSTSVLNTPNNSQLNLSVNMVKKKASPLLPTHDEKRLMRLLSGAVCLLAVCIMTAGVGALFSEEQLEFQAIANTLELLNYSSISLVFCMCNNDIRRWMRLIVTCNFISSR